MPNIDDAKGRVKEAAGDLTDDQDMKDEGKMDRAAASAKEKVDEARDKVGDAVDSAKEKLSGGEENGDA